MKKYLFLFLCFLLVSCQNENISSDISSQTHSESEEIISNNINTSFYSEEISNNDVPIVLEKTDNVCKILISGKEIEYKADQIIDGVQYKADKHIYLQDENDSNNFLVINGGTLVLNETTIVKKGDASLQNEDTLRKGINASILVIGKNSKVQISNVAINVFASYSSAIHCMYGGVAEIASTDILVISKASHAYSTYCNGMIFSESILTLVDSELVVAFSLYEGDGLISILGNNNYIEVHGKSSYVGVIKSGLLILKNIYGYSENSVLFNMTEEGEITLDNAIITESR